MITHWALLISVVWLLAAVLVGIIWSLTARHFKTGHTNAINIQQEGL